MSKSPSRFSIALDLACAAITAHPIMRPEGFASWQEELKFRDEINAAALSFFVEASQ